MPSGAGTGFFGSCTVSVVRAKTKVPRVARDDKRTRDDTRDGRQMQ